MLLKSEALVMSRYRLFVMTIFIVISQQQRGYPDSNRNSVPQNLRKIQIYKWKILSTDSYSAGCSGSFARLYISKLEKKICTESEKVYFFQHPWKPIEPMDIRFCLLSALRIFVLFHNRPHVVFHGAMYKHRFSMLLV